ncbi:unnamed protein product [Miscanthus lutarioriparius]|uniref:Uncharacterized protein n=1 Tax=Miscanthus lutarioriparius TaxID=422564 RepID=A0A811PGP0_9POAL|nr:unnamed protein product [Miscanthus lutarioriparius]
MGCGAIAAAVAAGASAAATAGIGAAGAAVAAACDGAVGAGAGGPRAMWWNNNTSGFVLRRMAQLVSDGGRPDKVFKDKDVNHVAKALKEYSEETQQGNELLSSAVGGKRKRGNFHEDEMLMLTNMSNVVNNVANALRETGPAHVDADLYLVVMEMPSFIEEALIVAYTYLLDNKVQGRGFVGMSNSHRDIWLRNCLAKNYYM